MINLTDFSPKIKTYAGSLGFDAVGITHAEVLFKSEQDLKHYIKENRQGTMSWLANTAEQRLHPKAYFPEARAVVMVALNYFRKREKFVYPADTGTISIYARGRDYHKVMRQKLKSLYHWVCEKIPSSRGRIFVDSFPIMEKPLAVRAGLGWLGKNTTLLLKGKGSYFFLGGILLNLDLEPDPPLTEEYCGSCQNCLVACPTGALDTPYQLDSQKCISYLTIEHHGSIENHLQDKMENLVFGCDICQMVCPWNQRFATHSRVQDFKNRFKKREISLRRLDQLSPHQFEKMFEGTPVRRSGYKNFLRNVRIAQKNLERSVKKIP